MEREGRGRRGGEKMRGRGIIVGGMVLGLLFGCNNGVAELEKKSTFYESVIKIGQGFQEIFGIFGNAMGEALGFGAVKYGDKKSAVGEHFNKVKKGLEDTKNKLGDLSGKISEAKNANSSTIETVKNKIREANEFLEQLMNALTKLAGVASVAGSSDDIGHNAASNPGPADRSSVETIIAGVKDIIDAADKSGVKIETGSDGGSVAAASNQTDALAILGANTTGNANKGAGAKLADEIAKADPWAMIDKIKNTTASSAVQLNGGTPDAGKLAASNNNATGSHAGAKSHADLAAAVALKAMTKSGTLSAHSDDSGVVKAAAVSAVNKVVGILDDIIRKTVNNELAKIKDAVKGIQYSETPGTNATEVSTSNK